MATLNSQTIATTDSGATANANASVGVNPGVASTVSTGLTNNFFTDSFFLPLLIAVVGIWLYRSGLFGINQWLDVKRGKHKDYLAQKELKNKILQIQQKESYK